MDAETKAEILKLIRNEAENCKELSEMNLRIARSGPDNSRAYDPDHYLGRAGAYQNASDWITELAEKVTKLLAIS